MNSAPNENIKGIILMVVSMLLMICMDAIAKLLVEEEISPIQIVAIRSWIILSIILTGLCLTRKLSLLKTQNLQIHGYRGLIAFFAPVLYFTALKELPIADATVIFFSATFMLTAASAIFFKEKVGRHRWGAVVIGFLGVIVAVNPQGGGDLLAYLLVFLSTIAYATSFLLGKKLSAQDSVTCIVFSTSLGMGFFSTLLLPWVWQSISFEIFLKMLAMSCIAMFGHYAVTSAFSRAEVSVIAPFEYTSLIWAVALGYILWAEIPSKQILFGAFIIVVSGLYVIHRESILKRRSLKTQIK